MPMLVEIIVDSIVAEVSDIAWLVLRTCGYARNTHTPPDTNMPKGRK